MEGLRVKVRRNALRKLYLKYLEMKGSGNGPLPTFSQLLYILAVAIAVSFGNTDTFIQDEFNEIIVPEVDAFTFNTKSNMAKAL